MFYDLYCSLCKEKGLSPSKAAETMGISKANVTAWKNKGYTPRGKVLQNIADFFGVPVGYLLNGEEQQKKLTPETENELDNYLIKMLTELTPEEMIKVNAFVQGLIAARKA